MSPPTLCIPVGLPYCGYTTAAREFAGWSRALRLTKDEWVKALYGAEKVQSHLRPT